VGQTGAVTGTQIAADPALTATYARFGLARVGRYVTWAGDSITNGSASSNASVTSFRMMTAKILGGAFISQNSINAGVPGDTSALLLARMDAILAASPEHVHVQIGTNDANGVSLATFQANIVAIRAKCDAAGVPMSMGLIPPRGSSVGSTITATLVSYNMWLRIWAPRAGVRLADTYGCLVDPATRYLAAAYDSGDGTHPNNAGHLAMANAIATMFTASPSLIAPQPWPVSAAGNGLCIDPLMAITGHWYALAGPSFPAQSLVAAANNDLPFGQWQRFTLNNSGGGSSTRGTMGTDLGSGWAVGDKLLIATYVRGNGVEKVQVMNQSLAAVSVCLESPPSTTPGPLFVTMLVPTGATALHLAVSVFAAAGQSVTADLGACDVFNLTAMGLASTSV
jgi:lysophospholipase L1-like esterase